MPIPEKVFMMVEKNTFLSLAFWHVFMMSLGTLVVIGLLHVFVPTKKGYDCQFAEYPMAIDAPPAFIKACREEKERLRRYSKV
jgi:hypothetical protein